MNRKMSNEGSIYGIDESIQNNIKRGFKNKNIMSVNTCDFIFKVN